MRLLGCIPARRWDDLWEGLGFWLGYVVTFAFVTFCALNDFLPMMNWLPEADRSNTYIRVCWAIPLMITEVILQLVHMRRATLAGVKAKQGVIHS